MASSTGSLHVVEVVWDDAHGAAIGDVTLSDIGNYHRPTVMQTLGWLLKDDDVGVSVANERCMDQGDETYRGRTFIPRVLVKSVTTIKTAHTKRVRAAKSAIP